MSPKLYAADMSPPVRSVLLLAKAIDLDLDIEQVNLAALDHLKPEYLKLNPQHTVPTLVDNGFVVWDSHAINAYLVGKYAKDDSLYPRDLEKRAVIDQRLHFDSGTLFPRAVAIIGPILRKLAHSVPKEKSDAVMDGYAFLETFLEGKVFVAGNQLSIADFHIVATISQSNVVVPLPENRFPRISQWWNLMRSLPYYKEANQVGLDKFTMYIKSMLA